MGGICISGFESNDGENSIGSLLSKLVCRDMLFWAKAKFWLVPFLLPFESRLLILDSFLVVTGEA